MGRDWVKCCPTCDRRLRTWLAIVYATKHGRCSKCDWQRQAREEETK